MSCEEFETTLKRNFDIFERQTCQNFGSNANRYGFLRLFATLKKTIHQYLNHPIGHTSTLLSSIEIDSEIAPLIDEIWKSEIQTTGSCEDVFPGYIWSNFKTSNDFSKFMEIIYGGEKYNQSITDIQLWSVKTNFLLRHPGEDTIHEQHSPDKINRYGDIDQHVSHVSLRVSRTFPVNDYDFVLKKFLRRNLSFMN